MSDKNRKFKFGWHTNLPATNDAAGFGAIIGAFTYPNSCRVTNMDLPSLEFDTSVEEAVFCAAANDFTAEDLDDLKASTLNLAGLFDKSDAFQAGLDTKFLAKDQFSLEITHPNGTDILWYQVQMKKNAPLVGGPNDKFKFDYSFIIKELPVSN